MTLYITIFLAMFSSAQACHPTDMVPMRKPITDESKGSEPIVLPTTPSDPFSDRRTTQPTQPVLLPLLPILLTTRPSTITMSTRTISTMTTILTTDASSSLPTSTRRTLAPMTSTTSPGEDLTVKWTCSSALVQIETNYNWDPDRTNIYRDLLDKNLSLLQKNSGKSLNHFGRLLRKAAKVELGDRQLYGEAFFLPKIEQPCDELKEFVRKAVSYSKDIPRAIVACRCETAVEIYKVKPQQPLMFEII
nr:Protein Y38A10A.11 [Haemonchus contortus]